MALYGCFLGTGDNSIVYLDKYIVESNRKEGRKETADDILRKRYASGEISKDEFDGKMKVLTKGATTKFKIKNVFMKRMLLISIIILTLTAVYGYTQMGHNMMRRGMMGEMRQLMQWIGGQEVVVDLSVPHPPENFRVVREGKHIYEERCAVCHGEKGDGKGRRANELITKPFDFTSGTYKFRSTPSGSLPTDEDIYSTISRGIRGTGMLPWFDLSKSEKWAVTYYIKTFSERFTDEKPDPQVIIPSLRVSRAELIDRGMQVYEQAKCWECHGRQGRGDGPKSVELKDDWGRLIRPRDFTNEPFKRGVSVNDIFLTIATGLDGTPMASYGDSLPTEDILTLATYIKSLARQRPSRGMMGMMSMTPDEHAGMRIIMHGGMMNGGMMGPGMMR
jgi:cytochrome c oxidase cbb3-type subunit 2